MVGRICGTGSYVPEEFYDNHDLSKMVDTNDEWIRERTGIVRRHIAKQDTTASMAVQAAKRALENGNVDPKEVDLILIATMTPNFLVPSMACVLQKELGAEHAAGFDLNAACSGFIFAYQTAQAYIQTGIYKTILLVGSETLSSIVNWKDRGSCILFGDGAGAVVLRAEEGESKVCIMHSDGKMGEVLLCESRHQNKWEEKNSLLQMDGQEVFKFAVKKVPEVIQEVLDQVHMQAEDIDLYVLHQANRRIIESIAKRMKVDVERFPMNLSEYGNTSSASIPILLDELNRSSRLQRGQNILMAGFGAGLSWGAALLEW